MSRPVLALVGLFLLSGAVQAIPTDITVRVLAKDAKFIGSGMDGASIIFQDAISGELLAEGIILGKTGDTKKIMSKPRVRGRALSTKGSASFTATLDLERPTKIRVIVEGPLSNPDSANQVTVTQWVIPGKHITGGDGWLLEIPGFSVEAQASVATAKNGDPAVLTMSATITMMCGCPIEPKGMWDANGYEVAAILTDETGRSVKIEMQYAGETSVFTGTTALVGSGPYEALVYAYDVSNGNTGVDITRFTSP